MGEPEDGNEDLTSEIFAEVGYEPAAPPKRRFEAWHRPRKQFIRREQWAAQLRKLYQDRPTSAPVRYLGLPGVDLLDLRYLHREVCGNGERPLLFLGFNREAHAGTAAETDLNTSLDEVRRLPNVDQRSLVIPDDLRCLAHAHSIGSKAFHDLGPFDVVNVDLCDGLGTDPPEADPSLYAALAGILALQMRSPQPWLFLLTSRIGRQHVHDETASRWLDHYQKNLDGCEPFRTTNQALFGLEDGQTLDPKNCTELEFFRLMIVAMVKWLLLLLQRPSPNHFEVASTQVYKVDGNAACEDLVSLAIRLEPVMDGVGNPLGLDGDAAIEECKAAAALVSRIAMMKNVDALLANDTQLEEELMGEMEGLLAAARYDTAGYRGWLDSAD